jgi:hypothetical protein
VSGVPVQPAKEPRPICGKIEGFIDDAERRRDRVLLSETCVHGLDSVAARLAARLTIIRKSLPNLSTCSPSDLV